LNEAVLHKKKTGAEYSKGIVHGAHSVTTGEAYISMDGAIDESRPIG
jgi:hypothetical protein